MVWKGLPISASQGDDWSCCVYALCNSVTKEVYIGMTGDWDARFAAHASQLRGKRHHTVKMQESFNENSDAFFGVPLIKLRHGFHSREYLATIEDVLIRNLFATRKDLVLNHIRDSQTSISCVVAEDVSALCDKAMAEVLRWMDGDNNCLEPDKFIPPGFSTPRPRKISSCHPIERIVFSEVQIKTLKELARRENVESWQDYVRLIVDEKIASKKAGTVSPQPQTERKIIPPPSRLQAGKLPFLKPGETPDLETVRSLRRIYPAS